MDHNQGTSGRIASVGVLVTLAAIASSGWGADALTLDAPANLTREPRTAIALALHARAGAAPVKYAMGTVKKNGASVPTPTGIALDADKGTFTWTPTESQSGLYEIEVSAKDADGKSATTSFRVTVNERPITGDNGPIGQLLKKWHAEGTAAGNVGDFYDNRDRDHSPLHRGPWPQLDQVVYTQQELDGRRDWAAQHTLRPVVTFGNSSTSAPVTMGGSNIRMYLVHPRGAAFLYEQYRGNNLYMYPGHHDHHPGHNGRPQFYGDVYPANTPYLIGSQGSSGTDQPFMRAVPYTLAAFRPEVKKKLVETGLLMPTVQMIFRASNKNIKTPEEYLTGKAHPTIFEGSQVDDLKMVNMAHEITLEKLPPLVQMKVVEEDEAVDGKDYFEAGKPENLFDTPCAIARIVRGPAYIRRMVVSAEASFDANKKPLTFKWVVLRGYANRIQIKPKNDAGSVVELLVPYHGRRVIPDSAQKIESNRVDIGCFVNNGSNYSAPGFVTLYSLDNEARTYDKDGKVIEIGYGAGEARLTVTGWQHVKYWLNLKHPGEFSRAFQQSFTEAERTRLREAAEDYELNAFTKVKATNEKRQFTAMARDKAAAAFRKADDSLKAAQKAHAAKPTPETEEQVKITTTAQKAAEEERKTGEAAAGEAQKAAEAASREAEAVLSKKLPGLEVSMRDAVERRMQHFRDDPLFSITHAKEIDEVLKHADAGAKAKFAAARKQWVDRGLLKQKDNAFEIQSVQTGDKPLPDRLTNYEKDLLRRYNGEILSILAFPELVSYSFVPNFVDQRLAARKEWRDVFKHDDAGRITGWTRIDATGSKEYTADGRIALEKDEKGRPVKARNVAYTVDWIDRRMSIHGLKPTLGDTVAIYEYGPDGKAKVVREEKVIEKK